MYNILVIDDEPDIRTLFSRFLARAGYSVEDAEDGEKGMNVMHNKPIDLVITDIIMPNKEGVETILELRAKYPDVKIIAMSGGGRNIAAEDALGFVENLGVFETFQKPFDRHEVLEAVEAALAN